MRPEGWIRPIFGTFFYTQINARTSTNHNFEIPKIPMPPAHIHMYINPSTYDYNSINITTQNNTAAFVFQKSLFCVAI